MNTLLQEIRDRAGLWVLEKKSDFGDALEVARYSKFMRFEVFKSFKIQIEMQKE